MREFEAFALCGKHHGVVAHHIATTKGVHSDLFRRAWAGITDATVGDVVFVGSICLLIEDLQERACRAGRRIDLVTMVHFGHFNIKGVISKNGCCFPSEMKEDIDAR